MFELACIGFLCTLGGKAGIDTYDKGKELVSICVIGATKTIKRGVKEAASSFKTGKEKALKETKK